MTRLGFVLASDSCIGCHACTVACKSEHDVPLGVNRTWVKYIETGEFPDTARTFTVMRCNQCDDAPCISICPTRALYRAPNGVVDFDDSRCIGCKACMNACPYDAIYINPETNTAHKCNFCNHRVEVGLEPACVTVCPTHAIITGDLDDPTSEISRIVANGPVAVRAPEQGTRPKVFYRGASQATLDPTRTMIRPDGMIWADTTPGHSTITPTMAEAMLDRSPEEVAARTTYTTAHPATWGTKVSAYLVTKAIAAGTMLVAALLVGRGDAGERGVGRGGPRCGRRTFHRGHRRAARRRSQAAATLLVPADEAQHQVMAGARRLDPRRVRCRDRVVGAGRRRRRADCTRGAGRAGRAAGGRHGRLHGVPVRAV